MWGMTAMRASAKCPGVWSDDAQAVGHPRHRGCAAGIGVRAVCRCRCVVFDATPPLCLLQELAARNLSHGFSPTLYPRSDIQNEHDFGHRSQDKSMQFLDFAWRRSTILLGELVLRSEGSCVKFHLVELFLAPTPCIEETNSGMFQPDNLGFSASLCACNGVPHKHM